MSNRESVDDLPILESRLQQPTGTEVCVDSTPEELPCESQALFNAAPPLHEEYGFF
jgi:hypothetical protein